MTSQEPAWLKRTRPCPFFSQGRCLFADSCNFLHDVKVRNAIDQSVRNTVLAKQSPIIKPVFYPPSVVVNSASPRSVNLSSPETSPSPSHGSSRYSGLLSALSDVIDPPLDSAVTDDLTSKSLTPSGSARRTSYQSTVIVRSPAIDSPVASESSFARFKFPVAGAETDRNDSAHSRSVLHPIDEDVPDPTSSSQEEVFFEEEDVEPVVAFMPVPDDDEAFLEGTTLPYLVRGSGSYVIGSDDEGEGESEDDEDPNARPEEDPAMIASNRHSILSSFTGASLLASPPGNVFGETSVASPIDDGPSDLLSPVAMSAKLRPFPIPSFDPKAKRGDSIDSGYADSWTSPLLFPPTPPRTFRSSVGFFPSHSRRASLASLTTLPHRRVSYDVRAVRPSHQKSIQAIEEGNSESDESSGDNEDTAFTILGAYDSSLSEEQEEDEVQDSGQDDIAAIVKRTVVESDKLSVPPSLSRRSWQASPGSPQHLRSTSTTSDLEACSQPSFVSDDKESFITAFSTQPSFDNLSDVSTRISPVKQDSLLSFISRTSTPDTSLLSHDDHSRELLDRHVVESLIENASGYHPIEAVGSAPQPRTPEVSQEEALVLSSPTREVPVGTSSIADANGFQDVVPHSAAAGKKRWSQVEVLRTSPLAGDASAPRHAVPGTRGQDTRLPRHDMPIVSVPTDAPRSSPVIRAITSLPVEDTKVVEPDTLGVSGPTVPTFRPPPPSGTARHDVSSHVEDTDIPRPDRHSLELQGSLELTLVPSLANSVGYNTSSPLEDTRALRSDRHLVDRRVPEQSNTRHSPASDLHRFAGPGVVVETIGSHSPMSSYSEELSDSESFDGDAVGTVALVADGEGRGFSGFSPSAAYSGLTDIPSAQVDNSLTADNSSFCEDLTESSSLGSSNFTQSRRLTFPLPPPFVPAEFLDYSTLPYEEEASVVEPVDIAEDEAGALSSETPAEEVQRLHSGSDLTERAGPSKVRAARSPEPGTDFSSRWGRITKEQMPIPSARRSADVAKDVKTPLSILLAETHVEEARRLRSGSDLTERAAPSPSLDSDTDFFLQRSRAASDITVKAKSPPVVLPTDVSPTPVPLSVPVDDPPRSDSVQSLYDRYFDDHTSGGDDEDMVGGNIDSSSPNHQGVEFPDLLGLADSRLSETSTHFPASPSHVFPLESVSGSGVDLSAASESVLRPLLTGRRSLLTSSLGELISKEPSSMPNPPSNRLQTREPGSTMVPLGFRRFKPKPLAQPLLRSVSQPLHSVLPITALREALSIRTDIPGGDLPPACSSAGYPPPSWSPLPTPSLSAPPTTGLKPLRLSVINNNNKRSSVLSSYSSSIASSIMSLDRISPSSPSHSPTVSSVTSFSRNSLLSSSCPPIPEHIQHTLTRSACNSPVLQPSDPSYFSLSRRDSRSVSAPLQQPKHWRLSHYRAGSRSYTSAEASHRLSRRTSTLSLSYVPEQEGEDDDDPTIVRPIQSSAAVDWIRPASALAASVHAIATPKPTLLFAIASDDVEQVRQVLESGEAGPNDPVGPQSALAFTLTNDKLLHKQEIVKALLAYGANPAALRNPATNPSSHPEGGDEPSPPPPETTLEGMDPATRYFVARADAAHTRQTSQLIYRSFFRPLTRVRYDVIGQDWALEQLFRVLSMHSQKLAVAPIVVLLCGPSGHGKSLLARKFGSLLDVPTHTVNMTTLRSTHDIWQSYSMSPYEEPSSCTLAEFLMENEGKRCVVVLDEIEKVEDQKALWSLLMPWELGRCSLEAGRRHVDARNVIWLGTSNVGHELVFEHHQSRAEPEKRMSRQEYLELTEMLRPRVSHHLGASLVSRVTTVLPFVPFTLDERKAIAAEAVYALAGENGRGLSSQDVESLVIKALPSYHPSEGARSLHRAISNLLIGSM